ncbi:formyltetrahydrofolate deformylase [Pseudohongiella nitratireducens]|uniref:Formyltetrahydrofolate deformylase n=1 Tax=Pseudohongiella nitratireducens TaxID=1768907 RepID=A0A917GUU4_9GAMM|nr:formyltetrahydrofolate deformylase [Pseudohongiella nitratireducens]MDF1622588.1 formyltetrahydrofolate deformylase [Pseudohongiella nitratireducens]GGG57640.1 formyltetrahydrofolate deformylase [Pseudohongiella nitratireducens]|tara:strand:- start:544 stop:1413 length:870 start_codon:yes stop_codon:yes gene_type:complete
MDTRAPHQYVLTVACPEANGIVRAVSDFLYQRGATISEAAQHRDPVIDRFFMRVEFEEQEVDLPSVEKLDEDFASLAQQFEMQWEFFDLRYKPRVLLAVSRHGHCLVDILHRWSSGVLPAEVVGVVSNHNDMRDITEWYGLPYYHLPVTTQTKDEQEGQILEVIEAQQVDVLALARYMQILSPRLCEAMAGRAINIHHSFLPGFKGANPYRQAYMRGVKIIGATAHYVTTDLDEGPIIEQSVERIDHNFDIEELVQIGRDAECAAFARALKWHCEHRIIINGNKTVVFK